MKHTRIRVMSLALGALMLIVAACGGRDGDAGSAAGTTSSRESFDRAFIDAMVPHHEGAIEMARAAKEAGLSQPDLIGVADAILATQQREIDQMKEIEIMRPHASGAHHGG